MTLGTLFPAAAPQSTAAMATPNPWQWSVFYIFFVGGAVVLALYFNVYIQIFKEQRPGAFTPQETWRSLHNYKSAWAAIACVTTASVLATFLLLVFDTEFDRADFAVFAFPGAVVFMAGAISWPLGILRHSMPAAQTAVAATAVGAAMILVYAVLRADTPWIVVAASMMTFHHAVIDGAWAAL